jgi:hypothetical protein
VGAILAMNAFRLSLSFLCKNKKPFFTQLVQKTSASDVVDYIEIYLFI